MEIETLARRVAEELEPGVSSVWPDADEAWSPLRLWWWIRDDGGWLLAPLDWNFAGAVIESMNRRGYSFRHVSFQDECHQADFAFLSKFPDIDFQDKSLNSGPEAVILAAARALGIEVTP